MRGGKMDRHLKRPGQRKHPSLPGSIFSVLGNVRVNVHNINNAYTYLSEDFHGRVRQMKNVSDFMVCN